MTAETPRRATAADLATRRTTARQLPRDGHSLREIAAKQPGMPLQPDAHTPEETG